MFLTDTAIARAERMCAEDPDAAAIRKALLEVERLAHATGWDGPDCQPKIFRLDLHAHGPDRVAHAWCDDYTDMMHWLHENRGYGMGEALSELGRKARTLSQFALTGVVPPEWSTMPPEAVAQIVLARDRFPQAHGKDLEPPACGDSRCRFLGFGLRSEAWVAATCVDDPDPVPPSQNPRRQEVRTAYFMGREGTLWTVLRRRGDQPKVSVTPISVNEQGGPILRGLSLMVDAAVPEDVPIWPNGWNGPRSGKINPPTG